MLSADGLRWMVAMVLENVKHSPVIEVLLGTMTLSTLTESGFLPVCLSLFRINKTLSLKKKRAFQISMVVLVLILILIGLMVFLPGAVLLSAFGTYHGTDSADVRGNDLRLCIGLFLQFLRHHSCHRLSSRKDSKLFRYAFDGIPIHWLSPLCVWGTNVRRAF